MPSDLPYAADAEESLSPQELNVLKLQFEKERYAGHLTIQTKFNYSWGLVKSGSKDLQTEGVKLLQEIYAAEPQRRRECLYYLALGYYKLGSWDNAKKFNDLLLSKEPTNLQAQSLNQLIDSGLAKEGYIGMALAGGMVAVIGVVAASLIRRSVRK
ncbi:mitochondrial fission 1 protein [Phaffia rhodozyma]|uniref:Mitochondrial fission 1 protein n=1 Tax=Phaffia rhodozyma TaxID=264483 RepID=A0A0F7SKD5_PHARH|nr:mitochondrial fission 1 protein [Phaffia rhodozyma]